MSPDLLLDRGTPSLLHSTETVEDGGGLTLQGSTTVWPTKASTEDGSLLSMVTAPTVKLKTRHIRGQEEEGRTETRESEESPLELSLGATKESIKSAPNRRGRLIPDSSGRNRDRRNQLTG